MKRSAGVPLRGVARESESPRDIPLVSGNGIRDNRGFDGLRKRKPHTYTYTHTQWIRMAIRVWRISASIASDETSAEDFENSKITRRGIHLARKLPIADPRGKFRECFQSSETRP